MGMGSMILNRGIKIVRSSVEQSEQTMSADRLFGGVMQGRVRLWMVAIFPQCDTVALRLGKNRLHGAFTTDKDCKNLLTTIYSPPLFFRQNVHALHHLNCSCASTSLSLLCPIIYAKGPVVLLLQS